MRLTVKELNSALIACKRDLDYVRLEDRNFTTNLIAGLETSIKVCLEKHIQEVEVKDTIIAKCIKELSIANDDYVKKTQFGRR